MSQSQPRHAAPNPKRNIKAIRTVRFWAAPLVITLALMSALCALYLGGILNPTTNLRHFPIAVVNEDAGPTGAQIVDGLVAGLDKNKFDVRVVSHDEAKQLLDTGQVYGSVLIPPSFSSKLREFGESARVPSPCGPAGHHDLNQPAGRHAGLQHRRPDPEPWRWRWSTAKWANDFPRRSQAQTGGAPLAGAAQLGLASPIDIKSTVYNPLPNGTGNGLSAFYYALLLLLAGFTGSIVVSTLVDALLGYVPAEFGPVYRFAEQVRISRFQTLADQVGHDGAAGAAHVGGLPGNRPRARNAHRPWLATVGLRGIRDRRGGHHVQFVALGAGLDGSAGQHADLRDPRVTVCGRHSPAGGDAAVLPLAGRIRADAPGFPGRALVAVSQGPRGYRFVPGADHDVDRAW